MIETEPLDVLLIAMPFCDEYMPCLTLALFKSVLKDAGISSRVQHEFIHYAGRIGREKYRRIMQVCTIGFGHDFFACETIFGEAAHGQTIRSFDDYIRWMKEVHLPGKVFAGNQRQDTLETLEVYKEAKDTVEDYLDEAVTRVMACKPRIVAFISMFQQHNAMIALARRLKHQANAPFILAGGANCEGDAGSALIEHIEAFDFVFTGEGDGCIAWLCQKLLREGSVLDEELPYGIVSRTKTKNGSAPVTTDLDALPVPDFSDFYRERNFYFPEFSGQFIITAEDSRGCWWAARHPCRFCGLNGSMAHLYRAKSTERFAEELTEQAKKYPGGQCYFTGNILSLKHQRELAAALVARGMPRYGLRLFTEIKSSVTEEEVKQLAAAGFFWLQAGIESFSDGILRLMNKGVSAIRQVQTLKHCNAYDIALLWYILVGTPGETEELCEEVNEVLPKIMHLEAPNTVAHVMFQRYSYYTQHREEPGIPKLRADRGYDFVFPNRDFIWRTAQLFSPEDEEELARYYDYRRIGPAYEKLYRLTETWRNESPQFLYMKDKGDMIKILDTRLIARQSLYHLRGIEAELCRACRSIRKEDELLRQFAESFGEASVKEALSHLVEENLLLHIGKEYLTLAVDRDARKNIPA